MNIEQARENVRKVDGVASCASAPGGQLIVRFWRFTPEVRKAVLEAAGRRRRPYFIVIFVRPRRHITHQRRG